MAEEMIVPARCLVPLPANVAVHDACLVEPLAVAVHGIAMVQPAHRDRVAIVGGGTIGLCAVAIARLATREVCLLARHDRQKAAGERLGATLQPTGEYDLVIDCAGTSESLAEAVRLCRPGATVLLLATYWAGLTLPAFEFSMKQLRIVEFGELLSPGPQPGRRRGGGGNGHEPAHRRVPDNAPSAARRCRGGLRDRCRPQGRRDQGHDQPLRGRRRP